MSLTPEERKINESVYNKNYYKIHQETIKAKAIKHSKAYYKKHKEEIRIRQSQYYVAHKEQFKIRREAWKVTHVEECRTQDSARQKRRRAFKSNAEVNDFTHQQWITLQEVFKHRCAYCGCRAKGHLTQDHITPLSKGGAHTLSNIIPACQKCNSKKGTKGVPCPVQPILLLEQFPKTKLRTRESGTAPRSKQIQDI